MTQPDYVPVNATDRVRTTERLPAPRGWVQDRPAEILGDQPSGPRLGNPGPDQGYALTLAARFHGRLKLEHGEHEEDVIAGCLPVALKRASLFGRAPVIHDMELAFALFGFLGDAPTDLVAWRKPMFDSVAHRYFDGRRIADCVPDATLRLSPADVRARINDWRSLVQSADA